MEINKKHNTNIGYKDRVGQTIRGCKIYECYIKDKQRNPTYKVLCFCGKAFEISAVNLCNKAYKDSPTNCGCIKRITTNGGYEKVIGLNNIGKLIRMVTIIDFIPSSKKPNVDYLGSYQCACTCGKVFNITHTHLFKKKYRNTRASCGCFKGDPREHKREYETVTYHRLYQYKKRTSVTRNLEFSLTEEEFVSISKNPCFYCEKVTTRNSYIRTEDAFGSNRGKAGDLILDNIKGDRLEKVEKYTVPCSGIDRYDNTKGYIVENCVPCCTHCNTIKGVRSVEDFYKRVKELAPIHEQAARILAVKKKREESL